MTFNVPLMVEIMGRLAMLPGRSASWFGAGRTSSIAQDYSLILCLPISDPVPKPRVMLKALYRQDVDIIRRFMPLSLFPGNAIWHADDIEQMTAVKHESDAEGEDADMQVQDSEFVLVNAADQVPGTKFDQIGRVQVGPLIKNSPWHQDQRANQRAAASCGNAAGTSKPVTVFSSVETETGPPPATTHSVFEAEVVWPWIEKNASSHGVWCSHVHEHC